VVSRSLARGLAGGALVVAAAAALFFWRLGTHPLIDPDEARHAEVAREMAAADGVRRLFLPTLEYEPYREKPPAYYWLVTLAYRLRGVDEAAARGVAASAALLAVLGLYLYAVPREGVAGALGAAAVAATSTGWLALARYATLDMALTACIVAGVLAGLAWLERPPPRRPPLAPWLAAGAGTLVKGPLAAALVLGPLALAAATRRPRPTFAELRCGRGLLVAGAIVALLYVLPLALFDPGYLAAFATTNVRRLGSASPHPAPLHYYLLWLPVLFLPWTLLAVPAVARAVRDPARRPLLLWLTFVVALLSVPRGKLATYALSATAPLALLTGPPLARAALANEQPADGAFYRACGWLALAVLALAAGAALVAGSTYPVPRAARAAVALAAVAWAAAFALALARERPGLIPAALLGATLTLEALAVGFVVPAVAALHSDRDAAQAIAAGGGTPTVVAFAARAPSLVFYLGRPVEHTDDLEHVRELFARDAPVFLVAGHGHFERLEETLGPRAYVWWTSARRRLYANRPRS
jgi:4-amino-4-deoxy-L-arabinose transferase-like glycosyltransferase